MTIVTKKTVSTNALASEYARIMNLFYPVGSYYETSNTAFDPNTAWGGVWDEDTSGRVLVARSNGDVDFGTVGDTGGEKSHTLTTAEMPEHSHKTINYVGGYTGGSQSGFRTVLAGSQASTDIVAVKTAGGGEAHNNLQPYIVIKRWHRIA